jgi:hypothetical protein
MKIEMTPDEKVTTIMIAVVLVLLSLLAWMYRDLRAANESQRQEYAQQQIEWRKNSCPVYKSECGSKHKYQCELQASVVGRNRVGDMFVVATPSC